MSVVKHVRDRARSLWLRVLRSTRSIDDVDGLNRLVDGKINVIAEANFGASRFDIEAHLSRWESYNASPRG